MSESRDPLEAGTIGGRSEPLAGVTVVDLGQVFNAPYATMLMALAGAKVIKVEPVSPGTPRARTGARGPNLPFYFLNSNKRAVTLNLKDTRGRALLLEMVDRAQVVVENFRPGVMERLGLGSDVLLARDPTLIYASSSGYGQEGSYRDLPAMDLTIQAMGGVMSSTGFPESPPVKSGSAVADFFGGIHLYAAIVTALYQREITGRGACIDVAMLDAVLPSLLSNVAALVGVRANIGNSSGPIPPRTGNRHGGLSACPYNVYPTQDGYYAFITTSDGHWNALLQSMGRADLIGDPRYSTSAARVAAMEEIDDLIGEWTRSLTTDEVFRLTGTGVPGAPVRELRDVVDDPYFRERGMIQDVDVPGIGVLPLFHTPLYFRGQERVPLQIAPDQGEHNDEIFGEWLGHTTDELVALRAENVI